MNQAGVLSGPAQAGGCCQGALDHGAGVNIGPSFKLASLLVQLRFESLESLEKHFVIITGPSHSGCIRAA